jgi:hypothetical protein
MTMNDFNPGPEPHEQGESLSATGMFLRALESNSAPPQQPAEANVAKPAAPQAAPAVSGPSSSGPGEFTQMFQALNPAHGSNQAPPSIPVPPVPSAPASSAPANPPSSAPAPSAGPGPGEFTRIFVIQGFQTLHRRRVALRSSLRPRLPPQRLRLLRHLFRPLLRPRLHRPSLHLPSQFNPMIGRVNRRLAQPQSRSTTHRVLRPFLLLRRPPAARPASCRHSLRRGQGHTRRVSRSQFPIGLSRCLRTPLLRRRQSRQASRPAALQD